jgi:hypothetical protein
LEIRLAVARIGCAELWLLLRAFVPSKKTECVNMGRLKDKTRVEDRIFTASRSYNPTQFCMHPFKLNPLFFVRTEIGKMSPK